MRAQFERFVKQNRGLAIAILIFAAWTLVFLVPKMYSSFESSDRTRFWGTFILTFGVIMFLYFGPKLKKEALPKEKAVSPSTPRSYQQHKDEIERCLEELNKQRLWAYGCLIVAWIVILVGRWSEHPHYSHPIFALPVFILAFLAATKSWERENELDVTIAKSVVEGIALEKKPTGPKSTYFQDIANSYEGGGMWQFAFVRGVPTTIINVSFINAGLLPLLATHFSISSWMLNCIAGVILGTAFLFYARMACQPYYWMLEKRNMVPIRNSSNEHEVI